MIIINHPWWFAVLIIAAPLTIGLRHPIVFRHPLVFLFKELCQYRLLKLMPVLLLLGAEILVALALAQPQRITEKQGTTTVHGRDIIFALDFSGSMAREFKGKLAPRKYKDAFFENLENDDSDAKQYKGVLRIDAAQDMILNFIDARMERQQKQDKQTLGDAIGLIVFDDKPKLIWPLDRELKQLQRHGNFVPRTKWGYRGLGGGTNFGSTIPGPFDMAAHEFETRGESTVRVLVIVTDGENDLEPDVKARLIKLIKDTNIHLYVIGVGGGIAKEEVDIVKVTKAVGGKVFLVQTTKEMDKAREAIDSEESSPVPIEYEQGRDELFMYPLALALALGMLAVILEAIFFGR